MSVREWPSSFSKKVKVRSLLPGYPSEIGGGRVQISGRMTTVEATDTALLLRAGLWLLRMEIIEERLVGPSLGEENIKAGFKSTLWGFIAFLSS